VFLVLLGNTLTILILISDGEKDKEYIEQWFKPAARDNILFVLIEGRSSNVFLTLFVLRTEPLLFLHPSYRLQPKKLRHREEQQV